MVPKFDEGMCAAMDTKHVYWLVAEEEGGGGACVWRYALWATEEGCAGSERPDTLWRSPPTAAVAPSPMDLGLGWCVIPTYEKGACDRFEYATWDADIAQCVWDLELWKDVEACEAATLTRPDVQWYTE